MKPPIILAGGSGFIGQSFGPFLFSKNYDVVVLTRGKSHDHPGIRKAHWDGKTLGERTQFVNGALALVNLTGRSINTRHTPEHRREIPPVPEFAARIGSRLMGTEASLALVSQRCVPKRLREEDSSLNSPTFAKPWRIFTLTNEYARRPERSREIPRRNLNDNDHGMPRLRSG